MQIHEITHKPLKEYVATATPVASTTSSGAAAAPATATPARTSGSIGSSLAKVAGGAKTAAGGAAAVAGGIGSALGKSLLSKAFGGVDVLGNKTGSPMNRAQALKLGQDMAKTLMPVLQQNWSAKVQAALSQSRDPATGAAPTSPAKLTAGEQSRLKAELTGMINQAIQPRYNFDFKTLANNVGDTATPEGQTVKATAMQAIQDINQAIDDIYKATVSGGNPAQAWQSLVVDGIAPAQGVLAFDTSTGSGSSVGANRAVLNAQDLALASELGLNANDVGELQMAARNPTQRAQLLKMLGLPK